MGVWKRRSCGKALPALLCVSGTSHLRVRRGSSSPKVGSGGFYLLLRKVGAGQLAPSGRGVCGAPEGAVSVSGVGGEGMPVRGA